MSFADHEELDPRLVSSLSAAGYKKPTYIQDKAIPAALSGKSMVIASEAGNGKTLAYLVPLMQRALEAKDAEAEAGTAGARKNAPLAVVAVPGLELAAQVSKVLSLPSGQDLLGRAYSQLQLDSSQVPVSNKLTEARVAIQ